MDIERIISPQKYSYDYILKVTLQNSVLGSFSLTRKIPLKKWNYFYGQILMILYLRSSLFWHSFSTQFKGDYELLFL